MYLIFMLNVVTSEFSQPTDFISKRQIGGLFPILSFTNSKLTLI